MSNNLFMYLNSGKIYVWGNNEKQIFKEWSRLIYHSPTLASKDTTWKIIDGSSLGFVALKTDGSIWGIGLNSFQQFGGNTNDTVHFWKELSDKRNWVSVGISEKAMYGLNDKGEIWAMGNSIGDGTTITRNKWEQLIPYKKWERMYIDEGTCFFISKSKALFGYGSFRGNERSGLSLFIDSVKIGNIADKIIDIKSNTYNSCVLWDNGSVSMLGNNLYGQFGNGTIGGNIRETLWYGGSDLENFIKISVDRGAFIGVKADGSIWGCGQNSCGNLGDQTDTNRSKSVKLKSTIKAINVFTFSTLSLHLGTARNSSCYNDNKQLNMAHTTFFLDNNNNLFSLGHNGSNQCGDSAVFNYNYLTKLPINNIKKIKSFNGTSFALDANNQLWHAGENEYNQSGKLGTFYLFNGFPYREYNWSKCTEGDSVVDFDLTTQGILVLKSDGWVWSWGGSNYGDRLASGTAPRKTTTFNNWTKLAVNGGCQENFVCLLNSDNKIALYGNTPLYPSSVDFLNTNKFEKFAVGFNSVYVFRKDSVWTWGKSFSNIGVGNSGDPLSPKVLDGKWMSIYPNYAISRPYQNSQTFGINSKGALFAWGYSHKGNLGTLDSINGYIYTPKIIDTTKIWVQISSNNASTFGLTKDGEIYYWGVNGLFPQSNKSIIEYYIIRPKLLDNSRKWKYICSNEIGTTLFAIDENQELYAIGDALFGVQGNNMRDHVLFPKLIMKGENGFPSRLGKELHNLCCEGFDLSKTDVFGKCKITFSGFCKYQYVDLYDITHRKIGHFDIDSNKEFIIDINNYKSKICIICLTDKNDSTLKCKKYFFE